MSVYYEPKTFGLEILCTFNDPEASYSFDMFVIWKHADGRLFYARDSGCSCPAPFEDYTKLEDLTQITLPGLQSFKDAFESWRKSHRWGDDEGYDMCTKTEAIDLFDQVEAALQP